MSNRSGGVPPDNDMRGNGTCDNAAGGNYGPATDMHVRQDYGSGTDKRIVLNLDGWAVSTRDEIHSLMWFEVRNDDRTDADDHVLAYPDQMRLRSFYEDVGAYEGSDTDMNTAEPVEHNTYTGRPRRVACKPLQ